MMTVWLKDIKGRWHRIKCDHFEYLKGTTYVFFDAQGHRLAQYFEQNIIGFRIKRKKDMNGTE